MGDAGNDMRGIRRIMYGIIVTKRSMERMNRVRMNYARMQKERTETRVYIHPTIIRKDKIIDSVDTRPCRTISISPANIRNTLINPTIYADPTHKKVWKKLI